MSAEITFILPTMNRRQYICRAVDSCLACHSERVAPHVLVIDGMSDDGSFELLQDRFGNNPLVSIIRHERVGFQRTAYFGVLQVTTEYVTFMYDDDLISPYFFRMFEKMLDEGLEFVLGYGYGYDIDKIYPFKPIERLESYPSYEALLSYFGYPEKLPYWNVPFSPICCIHKTAYLKQWVQFSQDFASRTPVRYYFMIDQNIGPDIIIYLSGILRSSDRMVIVPRVVGQFSEHPVSMSIGYGKLHLKIGYWLGRLWAFDEMCLRGKTDYAARCGAFLLLYGTMLLLIMPFSADKRWFFPFLSENIRILSQACRHRFFLSLLYYLFTSIGNRIRSRNIPPLPE